MWERTKDVKKKKVGSETRKLVQKKDVTDI